jgi:hypothetical protein
MKLIEGSRYKFKVERKIEFEDDKFWVLSGPDNKRYLLSYSDYSSYNISESALLDCRVDKINCKGEVFLEPEHPYYREGSVYEFLVKAMETRINKSGENENVIILNAPDNTLVVVPEKVFKHKIPEINSSVSLVIDKIIKGSLIISGSDNYAAPGKSEDSEIHEFVIVGESKGVDERVYFIITDTKKNQYVIPREYYTHYGLKTGSIFTGRFIRYKEGHGVNVEPESPFFRPGEVYDFIVRDIIKLPDGMDDVMVIEDEYGYQHHVKPRKTAIKGQLLKYRVVKMRKGWPLLEEH